MNDKESAEVLMKLLEKKLLNIEEEEAVKNAIGLFSWTKLAASRLKKKKEKKEKGSEW